MVVVSVVRSRRSRKLRLPFFGHGVRAGFPSPADDYLEGRIDLNEHLIKHPAATFLVRARGDSMENAGIRDGATLVVDRSLVAKDGDVVIAVIDGSLTVKRLRANSEGMWLEAACSKSRYKPMCLASDDAVWGVVTAAINPLR